MRAKQNVNAVYAVPSIKAVESICVDILTDIAMYHSWGSFTSPKNDLAFRREFSQKKLAYAYEHNLTVPDGLLKEPNIRKRSCSKIYSTCML